MDLTDPGEEDRRALREAVRELLTRHAGRAEPAPPGGYDRSLWSRLCDQIGVAGLAVPQRYGGAGAGLLEAHVVLDELGRSLTPAPMLGSAVLAAQAVLHCGDPGACQRLLPGIADGSRLAALVWAGPAGGWDSTDIACTATAADRLTGRAHYVLDGDLADTLLVLARHPDGIGLYEVDPAAAGLARTAVPALDGLRRLAQVELVDVAARRLSAHCPVDRLRDIACVALSAEQVGAAGRALELTVTHVKNRVQFGQPIGAFQALQHRLAHLHVLVDSARSASYAAASATVGGAPDAPLLAAVAKVYCSETLQRAAAEMIQLHGGIGVTWEHDAHRYLKRAHGAAQLFGPPHRHLGRIASTLLDDRPAG
ncbi:MAG TPA: acyl-CoA dehydrogenase family protein [Catenuloplanes sp.]